MSIGTVRVLQKSERITAPEMIKSSNNFLSIDSSISFYDFISNFFNLNRKLFKNEIN